MKFEYQKFSCNVDVFHRDLDMIVRFYDGSREPAEEEIVDLVIADPGYGYIILKYKGDAALLSGFLNESVFASDEMVEAAIDYVERLSPHSQSVYMPYHVSRFKPTSYVEYNGEY